MEQNLKSYFYLLYSNSVYDASTESCSYYVEPNTTSTFFDINFNYSGKTYSEQELLTSIYFFPDMQLEKDDSISKIIAGFASLWMEDFKEKSENE